MEILNPKFGRIEKLWHFGVNTKFIQSVELLKLEILGKEIERKYLVNTKMFSGGDYSEVIKQAYLSSNAECAVRVRIEGGRAWLTVKGKKTGATRDEFEYAIPIGEALEMMQFASGFVIEKIRHRAMYAGMTWEIDEFLGINEGLWLAEIELADENQTFEIPPWVGREVTHDDQYYNRKLAVNPYSFWEKLK